jgi:cation:H+ antiporter
VTSVTYIQLVGGFIYLLIGADLLVRGSVALSRRARVPPVVVALTVVAFGTSLPELVVALQAAIAGYPGLVLGNVVGSNIANILLVGGVSALVFPLTCGEGPVRRDTAVMVGVSVVFIVLSSFGELGPSAGMLLLAGLIVISAVTMKEVVRSYRHSEPTAPAEWALGLPTDGRLIGLFIVAGAVGLPLGAWLVVESAVEIAVQLGITETVVGLTIIAFSTSLPELATTVVAALQRRTEVAVGTLIGSNIFNILAIMGVGAVVSPVAVPVPSTFMVLDFPVMLGAALALSVFVWRRRPIGRAWGAFFVAGYAAYIVLLFFIPGAATP